MKLATLRNGTRDGALCVVSRDLKLATIAYDVAPSLQAALDDWDFAAPLLGTLYEQANQGPSGSRWFTLDPAELEAPLPRAYQWIRARAYLSHLSRLYQTEGRALPEHARKIPWLRQDRSDAFLGARQDIRVESDMVLDCEAQLAVITGDVPAGVKREKAGEHIRLLLLANRVGTPPAVADEEADSFRQPSFVAFSPIALTPDELGAAWDGRKIHLTLEAQINDAPLGAPDAAADMQFDFPALIAAAAATRGLGAGTLIGSGAVSSRDALAGAVSIAEKRAIEQHGKSAPETAFLQTGDRLRIDMCDASGHSLFGAIEQTVVSATAPTPHAAPQNDLPPDAVLSSDATPETEPAP